MAITAREIRDMGSVAGLMSVEDGIARFSPAGEVTLDGAIEYVAAALRYCRENGHRRLLADVTGLTGVGTPNVTERLLLVEAWVAAAGHAVILALVVRPEFMDPEKVGVTMAYNRGFRTDAFTDPADAVAWLRSR